MITEHAIVTAIEPPYVTIMVQRKTGCNNCTANNSCSTSVLSKVLGHTLLEVKVLNTIDAKIGDSVLVGVHEAAFLINAFITYLLPLLFFLLFAIVSELILSHEGLTLLISTLALLLGFLIARYLRYIFPLQPYLLNKI